MIDKETQRMLRARYNPDGSLLRQTQMRMLEILRHVDSVCREHDISYWLSSGTLIGAARHGGFIPWDDDVDIEMLESDYERLISLLSKPEIAGRYKLCTNGTDRNFLFPYAKLHDPCSRIEEATGLDALQRYRGCFIDIFPLTPSGSRRLHRMGGKMLGTEVKMAVRTRNSGWRNSIMQCVLHLAAYPVIRFLGGFCSGNRLRHKVPSYFPAERKKNDIFPLSEISFEGFMFKAPADTDTYLKKLYGDYMKLPDSDKIHVHASKIILSDNIIE
ncbi:LicD family protein [uncultured Muribaculum sp.]|uniref:LicD family protein n=1 Tax=uncultured Muribaculum sp. TaxID=1918613 RepID=UPI0025B73D5A|nr:LicD family protein [uncultured Muribaculum sp.]